MGGDRALDRRARPVADGMRRAMTHPSRFTRWAGASRNFVTATLRVVPRRALDKGYTFRYPELEPALRDLLGR